MSEMNRINVILVHGTWGRGLLFKRDVAVWCEPNANFVARLKTAILSNIATIDDVTIQPFSWSGKNSVFARQKAAVRLEDILSKRGDQLTLVVAHSHGGNVALNAISKLNDPTNVYLCTLATPFLSIFEVNRLRRHSGFLFYIVGALITWNILHSLSVYSLLDSIIPTPFGALLLWWWLFVKGIKSIYLILEALLVNPAPPPGRSPTRWQKWPKLVADATPKDAKALNGRLLVLRGIDDEAALTLAAGAIINRISRAIYNVSAFLPIRLGRLGCVPANFNCHEGVGALCPSLQ